MASRVLCPRDKSHVPSQCVPVIMYVNETSNQKVVSTRGSGSTLTFMIPQILPSDVED